MLTTSFTKGFCTFTDRVFISPSVPTDNFDLPMENWFTIGTDRTDGQGFWGLPYALAIMLTTSFTKGFCTLPIVYSFFHPYRWTALIYRWRIGLPSVPTVPMDKVLGGTLCPCNNANYLIHERILHIYRSCIHLSIQLSIRTDGQLRFTDKELVYHRYRPYRWTRFLGATLCPCNNANHLIHERILHITDRVFISPSVPMDNFDLPMENLFTIGTDRTDGQGFWGLPYALAIMLTTSFTKGFCTLPIVYSFFHPYRWTALIYRWRIGLPSVSTVLMDKVFGGYLMPLQ